MLLSDAGHIAAVVVGLVSPLLITSKKYFPCKLLIIRKLKTLTKNIYLYLLTKRKHCITFVPSNAEAIPQTFTIHHLTPCFPIFHPARALLLNCALVLSLSFRLMMPKQIPPIFGKRAQCMTTAFALLPPLFLSPFYNCSTWNIIN